MQRITSKQLDHMALFINKALGAPITYHTRDDNGDPVRRVTWRDAKYDRKTWQIEIGHYHISGAYGGVCLHRTDNENGGVTDVFNCGHVPKRDLYNRMRAYLEGIERACKVMNGVEFDPHYNPEDARGIPNPQVHILAAQILHERHATNSSNTDEN